MLYPMFAMIILTFAVAFYLLSLRICAVKQGEVSLGYFRVYSSKAGKEPSSKLMQAARHYSNLFEVPLLFYITCLTALVFGYQTGFMLTLAWVFVVSRVIHSAIHLSYNNVVHRLGAFTVGVLCVLVMWIMLALQYGAR